MQREEGHPEHDPFAGGAIARLSNTTEEQREVLAAAALSEEANCAYNEAVAVCFDRAPDPARIERALQAVVARHDALRTTFSADLDQMCVNDTGSTVLEHVSLPGQTPEQVAEATEWWRTELMRTPMSLVQGPLFRAFWIKTANGGAQLMLLAHHAICDGWSFHVILEELQDFYADESSALPAAPSFADYADGRASAEPQSADWWREQLSAGDLQQLDLPTDRRRRAKRSFAADTASTRFERHVVDAIDQIAAQTRSTSVSVLTAAVAALLHRLTGDGDIVVGMPFARQSIEDRPRLVGHCVQLLPVRLSVDAQAPLTDLVTNARSAVLDATEHYDLGFGALVRELGLSGDASRVPLVPVILNVDQPLSDLRFGEAAGTVTGVPRRAEAFEIFLNVAPDSHGVNLDATFNRSLFDRATVEAWLSALEQLILAAARHPTDSIEALCLTTPDTTHHPIDAVVSTPSETWLDDLRARATESPERVAVVTDDDRMSYGELWDEALRLAGALSSNGVGPGDVVGVATPRGPKLLVSIAGVHLVGAAHLPLDPSFPAARLRFMLEDSGASCVVDGDALPAEARLHAAPSVSSEALPAAAPQPNALPAVTSADRAYLIYTSGSTGKPKGVAIAHGSLTNLLHSVGQRPGLRPDDALLAVTTVSFDISLLELLGPLTVGATVVVATAEQAEDPSELDRLLREHDVTVMQSTPATWRMLLEFGWAGRSSLRAFSGGERLPEDLAGALLPKVASLWNLYGPTETTIWSTVAEVYDEEHAARVGFPVDATRVLILDQAGNKLPPCIPGEICIAGAGVAIGYHDRPQLTAQRFVDHLQHGRYYRTGDLGRLRADGSLECLGRDDRQVKVRGHRIELGEIDAALTTHPEIADAAVVVVGNAAHTLRLVAHVVSSSKELPANIGDHLRTQLPGYMLPHQVIRADSLPRLPNGKLDRRGLELLSHAPERVEIAATEGDDELSDDVAALASAMAKLLSIDHFGPDLDFFAAGGHSLLAARLVTEINRQRGTSLSMRAVFEAPTPRQLAEVARRTGDHPTRTRPIERRAQQTYAPLTKAQERIWYIQQMLPDRPTYNLPSGHQLDGPLDVSALRRALRELIRRQDALRTTIERSEGQLRMVVARDIPREVLTLTDLSHLSEEAREAQLDAALESAIAQPFDLARGPLFRAHLYRLEEQRHLLFFMPHHIVWDGWSFDVFYREIGTIYAAFIQGREHGLPALQFSYGDFTSWHCDLMRSPAAVAETASWRARLAEFGPVSPLPLDKPRSAAMSGVGATEWIQVDQALTRSLHELAREHSATMFSVLFAAYTAALFGHFGEHALLIATPLRGRETPGTEEMMGCCNSLLPLPVRVEGHMSFLDLLQQAKETATSGLAHSNVALEKVVPRENASSTLYHALFSYQDARERVARWGPLHHKAVHLFQRGATEDLGLWFLEGVDGLMGGLTYNRDALLQQTICGLKEQMLHVLESVVRDPSCTIASLRLRQASTPPRTRTQEAPPLAKPASSPRATLRDLPNARGHAVYLLAAIWKRLLRAENVGLEENFFDMGGDSLLAIQSISEFEAATGTQIDLGEFLRQPTLIAISNHIARGAHKTASAVVPLQHLGDATPLYCLMGVGIYRHLAALLSPDQQVFGVYIAEENILAGGIEAIHGRAIDRVAAAYTEALRDQAVGKRIQLCGVSLGGVIALEVARRLADVGTEIERVILIDTVLPSGYRKHWKRVCVNAPRIALRRAGSWVHRIFVGESSMQRREDEQQDARSNEILRARREHRQLLTAEVSAWAKAHSPVEAEFILCRAENTSAWGASMEFSDDYGWRAVLGDTLTIIKLAGNHVKILQPPHVNDTAQQLRQSLGLTAR